MQGDESPVSVTYQVNGFDEVLEVVAQLTEQGIVLLQLQNRWKV